MATTTTTSSAARRRRTGSNPGASNSATDGSAATPGRAAAAGAAAAGTAPARRADRDGVMNAVAQSVIRALLLYAFLKYWKGGESPKQQPVQVARSNLWAADASYEIRVFQSLRRSMTFTEARDAQPFYAEKSLTYTLDAPNYRSHNVTLAVPDAVARRNASWFAHVFAVRDDAWDMPVHQVERAGAVLHTTFDMVAWRSGADPGKEKSLLAADSDSNEGEVAAANSAASTEKTDGMEEAKQVVISQLWKPTIPIALVTGREAVNPKQLPQAMGAKIRLSKDELSYYPVLYVNEFWLLGDMLRPMNETVSSVTLEMSFSPLSMNKWAVYEQFETMFDAQIAYGASNKREKDKIKRMVLETNPVLLGTTMVVSLAHSVFEALAFQNDISHWKSIKSMEGISVRSMMVKIFMEVVILLYLWDNDTSWMIVIGNAIGIAIEVWKLCKAVEFKNFGKRKLLGFIPWFEMKDRESYSKKTKEYDEEAMRYLSYVAYPLIIGYSIYSLVYEKHKSWYSWVLGSLVGTVYTFGFIMMFPQIFINYKLKSVAHLPMKAMMYKTLNTIVDDLGSFVIKMPWLHRLACFRDDVVFVIYLYQRWIYPVDKTRVNEFGQSFDEDGNEIVRDAPESAAAAAAAPVATVDDVKSMSSTISTASKVSKASAEVSDSMESVEPKAAELKKNE